MRERRRVRAPHEGAPQRRGCGVVLAEWREAEDLLNGTQDGRGRVERAVDRVTAGIGRSDQQDGAVRVHVVRPILRIVFEDEGRERWPRGRLRQTFYDEPSARSLSATMARGVGREAWRPRVWSRGS